MLTSESGPTGVVERASQGARLLTARGAAMRVVSIGSNLALVALVAPADFGLLAIVRGVTGVAGTSSDLGFAWALLRRSTAPSDEEYGALAGMQAILLVGFLALVVAFPSLLSMVGAVPAAWRGWMIAVLATMLTVPAGTGARIRIERAMDYRRIAIADMTSVALQNLALLGFAIAGRFALGVFVSTGATLLYNNLLLWYWSPGPGPAFRLGEWRRLSREFAGFSLGHAGSVLGNAVTPIVLAQLFGLSAAGIWSLAVRLGNVLQLTFEGFRRAAVPAAALLADSRRQLRQLAQNSLVGAARLTVPLMAMMYAALPALGWLLPKWAPAVVTTQLYILGFGLSSLLGASIIPVAVTLEGPRPVVIEQFVPLLVGWSGFGVLALLHRSSIAWAVLPMYGALIVALWRVARRDVRPRFGGELLSLGAALATTVAVTAVQQLLGVPLVVVPAAGVLIFGLFWLIPRLGSPAPSASDAEGLA